MPTIPIPENAIATDDAWLLLIEHAHSTAEQQRDDT
jgi:hypothetical protein